MTVHADADPTLLAEAGDLQDNAVKLRRHLHQRPELGLELPLTREAVLEALDGLDIEVHPHRTTSGIAAVIHGDHPGPTVLLRGDMDALPLHEDAEIDFRSRTEGAMHACGHDLHTAMLAGAARLLEGRRRQLHGNVLLMFQPGEEGFHGARFMLDEGLLNDVGTVKRAFALHVSTATPTGTIASRGGSLMASSDVLQVVVHGRGGHASAPHFTLDPIPVACEIVQALQMMITRRVDVFDPSVVTIAKITAGTTNNVIPPDATLLGTIRAVSERTRRQVHDGIRRVAEGIAAAHDCTVEVDIVDGFPVTVNDDGAAGEVLDLAGRLLGEKKRARMPAPVMGSEDFSYVLQQVPGAMAFLGATPPGVDPRTAAPNHSNLVRFDEDAMPVGMAMYAAYALEHLAG
jgi:amidohydrolase